MRPIRVMGIAVAAAALFTGCAGTSGSGRPESAGATTAETAATPTGAANGIDRYSLAEVAERAGAALSDATTVRVRVDVRSAGERITMDLRLAAGRGAIGTVGVQGVSMQLLRIKRDAYLKATAAAWQKLSGEAEAGRLLAGKWVKVPTDTKDFGPVLEFTDPAGLGKEILDLSGSDGAAKPRSTRLRLNGLDAVRLDGTDGTAMFIAATGKPYPLRISSPDPKEGGRIDFSDYGRPFRLTTPPASQVIDASS